MIDRRTLIGGACALPLLPAAPVAQPGDDSGRVIPTPATNPYPYRGVSGPGLPATDDSMTGGWMSGLVGVRYQGKRPMAYPTLPWNDAATGAAVRQGLIPPIRPLLEMQLRDTMIIRGGDGRYYMTGSTGDNIWAYNDGVELWRSDDLVRWDYLGLVWSLDREGGWARSWRMRRGKPFRAIWAPEIHYLRGNYYICFSVSRAGLGILRSTTGKPEGPYAYAFSGDAALRRGIDATLFEDSDGSVHLTYGSGDEIVRLKDDLSGYAGPWRQLVMEDRSCVRARERARCLAGENDLGYEGATLFRANGRYYLGSVDNIEGRYSFALAVSDKLDGPYRLRHEAVPCGGGGNFFQGPGGRWYCTYFGNDDQSPFRERPAIVPIAFDAQGRVIVDPASGVLAPAQAATNMPGG